MTMDLFTASTAEISECGTYRYELRRVWDASLGLACWVMLNPSTADADQDDPTIRRCMAFARAWGYGGIVVRNLYALRATDPGELRQHPNPVGPRNERYLLTGYESVALTVAAWGADPAAWGRAEVVQVLMATMGISLWCVGINQDGSPKHPLYVKSATRPMPYPGRKRAEGTAPGGSHRG